MIPCANPLAQYRSHRDEILEAVRCVLDGDQYVLGPKVEKLERDFSAYCGVSYGIGVNSGTDALILALRALDVGPEDEVITVSHTALATVSAIMATGATPVLVDVDPVYYTMDPESLRLAVTDKTKGVIAVHLYGQCADMDEIMQISRLHGLFVIEDCAQAAGAIYKGKRVGSIGDAGCFSFYPTKNLGAIGDGGMVVTQNTKLAERIGRLRQYGWDKNRITQEHGFNSRLDEIQAAILGVKFPALDGENARRNEIARCYGEALLNLPITLPKVRSLTTHVHHLYVITCQNRDMLKKHLLNRQVVAGIHYPIPVHRHGGYDSHTRCATRGLPVTEFLVDHILTLPLFPELTDAQVDKVIEAVRSYYV